MTQLWHIITTANSWCAVFGLLLAGAALLGLIVQQEIPHEWMSRLSRVAATCGVVFAGFAIARHYGDDPAWMAMNLAVAYMCALVALGVWVLHLRDEPDVEYAEPIEDEGSGAVVNVAELGAYINGNHQAPAGQHPRMVIDQPAGD